MSFEIYAILILAAAVLIRSGLAFAKGITTLDGAVVRHDHRPVRFWAELLATAAAAMLLIAAFTAADPVSRGKFMMAGFLLLLVQSSIPGLLSFHRRRFVRRQIGEPAATHWVILTATAIITLAGLVLAIWVIAYSPSGSHR